MTVKDTALPASFVGKTGRFYVQCPEGWATNPRHAVYSSVAAYDTRSELPGYLPAPEALADFSHELKIYPENLKTSPPDAAPWERDEPAEVYQPNPAPARQNWKFKNARPLKAHA